MSHYNFPDKAIDITVVSIIGALLCVLIWRWFSVTEKRPGNVKVEVLLAPLVILATLATDLSLIFLIVSIPRKTLLITIIALCLGIAWIIFKSLQWASTEPGSGTTKAESLKTYDAMHQKSVVVLPFKNMSADPEQEYFCEGITEELITVLSKAHSLQVISRTSAFMFKNSQKKAREIGEELNVGYVLEGSVRKAGNKIRIAAQLIETSTDTHIWSETYDGDLEDIFDIQAKVSHSIVDALELEFRPEGEKEKVEGPLPIMKSGLRKLVIPAAVVISLAALALVIWRVLPKNHIAAFPTGRPSLAVVYFENKTGDKSLDDWSTGLQDLLITDLSQSRFLRILSADKIFSILKKLDLDEAKRYSTDDLVKVANEGAAEYTISGSFIKAGSQILINTTLQKPRTEEVTRNIRIDCQSFDEITAGVDDLTKQIKAELNLTEQQIEGDLDKNLGKITSPNPEALRYYVEAKRYHWKGEENKAIPLLEKAVALDPEFILAYEVLASAHDNRGEVALNDFYVSKSLDLFERFPDRVTDKDRCTIEGRHYFFDLSDQFWPKAEEDLNKALDIDSEDSLANFSLGFLYNALEQWDKSLSHFNVSLKNKYEYYSLYRQMAISYRAKGMPNKARETIEYYNKNVTDASIGHCLMAFHYLTQGKPDLARQETEKAVILDPTYWLNYYTAGVVALLDGDFGQAEKEFSRLLAEKETIAISFGYDGLRDLSLVEGKFSKFSRLYVSFIEQMREAGEKNNECSARCQLAYVYLKSGNPEKTLAECGKSWAVAVGSDNLIYQRYILYLKGLAYLDLKNIPEAEKAANELKAVNARGMRKDVDIRIYDHLMGRIELDKKDYNGAIERLKKAADSLPYGPLETDASYIDSLALAYFRAGDLAKAQAEYERITALTTGWSDYGDIYAKSFYMLGMIAEQRGQKSKALEHYQKFLDLWKDADPGLPEVADARQRLAGLTGNS